MKRSQQVAPKHIRSVMPSASRMWDGDKSSHTVSLSPVLWPKLLQLGQILVLPWESQGKAIPVQDFRALGNFLQSQASGSAQAALQMSTQLFGWNLLRNLKWAMFGTEKKKTNSYAGPGLNSTRSRLSNRWVQEQGKHTGMHPRNRIFLGG